MIVQSDNVWPANDQRWISVTEWHHATTKSKILHPFANSLWQPWLCTLRTQSQGNSWRDRTQPPYTTSNTPTHGKVAQQTAPWWIAKSSQNSAILSPQWYSEWFSFEETLMLIWYQYHTNIKILLTSYIFYI